MRSAMLPKTLGKGSPRPSPVPHQTFSKAFPVLRSEWEQTTGPHVGHFQVDLPLLGTCVIPWLLAQYLCASEAFYTHLHEPQWLSCCQGALVRGCHLSKQPPRGLGLGPGSSQRPPEGLKSSPDFSGPWTPVFVTDLRAATGNERGRSRRRVLLPRSRNAHQSGSLHPAAPLVSRTHCRGRPAPCARPRRVSGGCFFSLFTRTSPRWRTGPKGPRKTLWQLLCL